MSVQVQMWRDIRRKDKYTSHCSHCAVRRAADRQATADDDDAVDNDTVKGTAWTAAEDALVKEMCERGCSNADIARCLPGRTEMAVKYRASLLRRSGKLTRIYK